MPIEKIDKNYVVRFITPLAQGFIVFLPLTLVVFILWKPEHWLLEVVSFGFVLAGALAFVIWLFRRFFRHYRCPQCQAELPIFRDDKLVSNRRYYCKSCDVIWLTGGAEDGGSGYVV